MAEIIKEMLKEMPPNSISDAVFEGANIVLYTKDKDFFLDNKGIIRETVGKFKKRIELRPDPSVTLEAEKAEDEIRKIITEEALIGNIIFDSQRSIAIIEVEKPGIAIGKQGENLEKIKRKTSWVPIIRRTPAIRSALIESIRSVLYQNTDYRRKFLNKTGDRIYNGWMRGKKEEWVRITFLGGGRQIGRSALLLQTPESRVLLDCGIDVSQMDSKSYPHFEAPEFKIEELDAVVISHAHTDHTGFLPFLYKMQYKGPVYCTEPTRDIMALLQLDAIKISRGEGKEPLYSSDDIKEMVKHTITLDYEEVSDITPDVRITLYNAGHMLGSAMVHLHIGNGLHNLLYTADQKYGHTALLSPAMTKFPRLESMIIESTYGSKNASEQEPDDEVFIDIVQQTIKRGGKVLMPTLGSGRAQEVLIIVEQMMREGKIPKVPVYIDGMVWDITAIHTAYPEFLNSTVRNQIFHKDNNPFLSEQFSRVGSNEERKKIIEDEGPCIVLATSGMLNGGPSVEYLKSFCENNKNSLVFSSYQGEGTLGRKILNGDKNITFINGQKQDNYEVKMEVHKIIISGHSSRKQLMNFVRKVVPRPRKIIVNHGEKGSCIDLASSIHKQYKIETVCPANLDAIRLR
ncbi:beta-CASP ribonuclease aCPSF1 [Candidatus Woesearchaeota archaeon]|nr:MAG: beta-CASP ribonuclease aCPSF1 [Candidatus Woesearchaeota archaeon]